MRGAAACLAVLLLIVCLPGLVGSVMNMESPHGIQVRHM
jgi:hypothetical protein